VVFSESHKESIRMMLKNSGIEEKFYHIVVLEKDRVFQSYEELYDDKMDSCSFVDLICKVTSAPAQVVKGKLELLESVTGPFLVKDIMHLLED